MTFSMRREALSVDLKVHPAAAVFPMLSDDELRDLAEDIKANGLIHPIVLDADGQLIDGRNRLAACNLAGVEPRFETLDGQEPVAYILSSNINRRHMSKGQQAMAVAKVRDFQKLKIVDAAVRAGVSVGRVGQAAVVLEYAPDKADSVLLGFLSLDEAYGEARGRKDTASSMETQMGGLRTEAPDLADLVTEERMALREALAALDRRRADEKRRKEAATAGLLSAVRFLAPPAGDIREHAENFLASFDPALVPGAEIITPEQIERSIAFLTVVRRGLGEGHR